MRPVAAAVLVSRGLRLVLALPMPAVAGPVLGSSDFLLGFFVVVHGDGGGVDQDTWCLFNGATRVAQSVDKRRADCSVAR